MTNGFAFIRISSWRAQLDTDKTTDVAPSLHRHYSDFITPTSDSVPVPRIGTQVLVGSPLERLPSHRDDWFPQFRREAWIRLTPPARRTPPGQPSGQPPDSSRRYHPPSVSMSCTGSRRVSSGSLAFVFLIHTCRVMLDVSPTLTTSTLDASREVCFLTADFDGPPVIFSTACCGAQTTPSWPQLSPNDVVIRSRNLTPTGCWRAPETPRVGRDASGE